MACVRERLRKGDIEGAREARAQAALEFEEAKENRDAELAVGIRDLLNTPPVLLSRCFRWCYDILWFRRKEPLFESRLSNVL